MSFTIATPEDIQKAEDFLAKNSYLSGGKTPGTEDADLIAAMEEAKFVPVQGTHPNLFGWWWVLCPFREGARNLWRKPKEGQAVVQNE